MYMNTSLRLILTLFIPRFIHCTIIIIDMMHLYYDILYALALAVIRRDNITTREIIST